MLSIRHATLQDVPLLCDIERSAGQAFLSIPALAWIADDEIQSQECHREFIRRRLAWVATDDQNRPIGFINASPQGDALYIEELSVRHERQGQGIGRRLVEQVIAHARRHGFRGLTLTTFRQVPWNAPFYQRLGFTIVPEAVLPAHLHTALEQQAACGFERAARCGMLLTLAEIPQ
ncbi:GNAT family N-acetyltransferase [Entomohabitans teleogrylli]|uniref:GNAT family N-acetyltransferase n=1 Tax=Entomohabitans teleogrylli TaxID=1384589 RepID=UPI00073D29F5|nr:GNAT family N-acetyltransferase [Entomohabitans teleogrylli]